MTDQQPITGDLEKTSILAGLFNVEENLRDNAWKQTFIDNVLDASFTCSDPQVITGPDGFPYFVLNTPEQNTPFQAYVVRDMIPNFLIEQGIGIAINPQKGNPDWVFSYGDIVNFYLRNEFYSSSSNWGIPQQNEGEGNNEQVLVGQPSEYIIPQQTRRILSLFFESLKINDTKIALLNRPKGEEFLQQLVFNITPDKFTEKEHFNNVMGFISWFLPKHYSYAAMDEATLGENFMPI